MEKSVVGLVGQILAEESAIPFQSHMPFLDTLHIEAYCGDRAECSRSTVSNHGARPCRRMIRLGK